MFSAPGLFMKNPVFCALLKIVRRLVKKRTSMERYPLQNLLYPKLTLVLFIKLGEVTVQLIRSQCTR
jgi:hypothetical protein